MPTDLHRRPVLAADRVTVEDVPVETHVGSRPWDRGRADQCQTAAPRENLEIDSFHGRPSHDPVELTGWERLPGSPGSNLPAGPVRDAPEAGSGRRTV